MSDDIHDLVGQGVTDTSSGDTTTTVSLYGTLDIEGAGEYYVFCAQAGSRVTWTLTNRDVFTNSKPDECVEAILRIKSTGRMEGLGKTYLLTRLLDGLNTMVGRAAASKAVDSAFAVSGYYKGEGNDASFIQFRAVTGGRKYTSIELVYEGFRMSVNRYNRKFPFRTPKTLHPVEDERTRAAMIAGLGVRTFSLLRRQRGHALDWYDRKDYRLVTTNEEFQTMMLAYLTAVQEAHNRNRAVLTGLDTETTGLNMLSLDITNPLRDHIVAIPFSWEDDKGFVICTDMHYFHNVDEEEIYPLFDMLFRRNEDYTYQDIELDYCGQHFKFNRKSILVVGANAGFDERGFFCHGAHVFFDEDIQIIHYNLATDWVQGKNSLKSMTHRYLGDETLELEDLFGKQHKDKYRYLSDPELALVYGGADGDYTRLVFKYLRPLLPDNLYKLYKKYDITTLYRTALATWKGMNVNTREVKKQGEAILQDMETIKDFIYRYAYAANRNSLEEKASKLCELLGLSGVDELQEYEHGDGMYRYPFTPANHKHLLFNILGYPVLKVNAKSQEPALDKFVLKKLASRKRETPIEFLREDIVSKSDPSNVLISKDQFNSDMYPLARVFQTYAEINKEYTAYYKPIMTNDLEDRMFYTFSLQRAATRRILSAGQTMKGKLKKLVVAPPGKLFMCFDASQIEYRHMASLAYIQTKDILQTQYPDDWENRLAESGIARIHTMMHNEESDYHIETASMMTGLPQYQIDHATRKMYKSIGFGIPYGLGDQSMCESLFGKVTKDNMEKTKQVLADYKQRQFEIIRLLETVRDSAFVPAKIPDKFRMMLGIMDTHVGIVCNFVGFYRLFILEKLTRAKTGRIRRQAGNCIIQGGAAELFRRMIYNFYMGCVQAGIADKVDWLMLVHDEVDNVVDADIDVCKLLDVIQTSCTLRYKDHIPYYVGIGFGHNWKEAKDDAAELPVIMVDRLVAAYRAGKFSIPCDGNQPENLAKLKRHYLCDRIGEVLHTIVPDLKHGYVWTQEKADEVGEKFTNYMVRGYLSSFITKEDKATYGKDVPLLVSLQRWQEAREAYGFGKDFLSETFTDVREEIKRMDLDGLGLSDGVVDLDFSSDDLRIELLDDSEDVDIALAQQEQEEWYGEDTLFDYTVAEEERVLEDADEGYRFFNEDGNAEDDYELNANATNAFDLYVSKQYVRKCIFSSGENTFTIMLKGTGFSDQVSLFGRTVKQEFGPGNVNIILIGDDIRKVTAVGATTERLDKLDQLLSRNMAETAES